MSTPTPQPGLSAYERAQCQVMAALLQATRVPAAWGLMAAGLAMLTAIALALALALALVGSSFTPTWQFWTMYALLAALFLSPFERYLAFRLQLDAQLFAQLASGAFSDLASLDRALSTLGLRASAADTPTRPLADRLAGTLRLMRHHGLVLALQGLAWLAALLIAAFGSAN